MGLDVLSCIVKVLSRLLTVSYPPSMQTIPFLLGLVAFLGAGTPAGAAEPTLNSEQQKLLERGQRHERDGWIYVHLEGSPRARGFQHGYLLNRELAESLRK